MAQSNTVMLSTVTKFRRSGSVLCQWKGKSGQPVTVSTRENHAHVLQQVLYSPRQSLQQMALKLNVSDMSVRRLFKDIGGFPYQIQVGQRSTESDMQARMVYCGTFLAMVYEDPDVLRNVFSDKSHIHLDAYINRQTTHFLGFEWPNVIVQKPLHSTRVTIWCTVSAHGILGPYFIEDEEGNALTVTQACYRDMVIRPFLQDLRRFCHARGLHMDRQWYQQDHFSTAIFGAYCICEKP
ncbi:hypothetical protein B7P43_G13409 [Cryptotermes secundus]|uniref:Uncharacterized protein n=1 Tax=Cryptotermes secundus TaxID=105785 RepID=A0A2J7QP50_9NEOP|nr:hypothetical protein B7P43_G13409 [Cryptotermes secundus]